MVLFYTYKTYNISLETDNSWRFTFLQGSRQPKGIEGWSEWIATDMRRSWHGGALVTVSEQERRISRKQSNPAVAHGCLVLDAFSSLTNWTYIVSFDNNSLEGLMMPFYRTEGQCVVVVDLAPDYMRSKYG